MSESPQSANLSDDEHRAAALNAYLTDWEAEHGPFTDDELDAAERRLGPPDDERTSHP